MSSGSTATIRAVCSSAFSRMAMPSLTGVFSSRKAPTSGMQRPQARQAELVDLGRPLTLPQPDAQHLEQPALVPTRERRVRLDPIEEDDAVGLVRIAVEMDRQAE